MRAGIDQNRLVIDHGVAILGHTILFRHWPRRRRFTAVWTVAGASPHDPNRVGGAISVRSQPAIPKVEMGLCRERFGDSILAPRLGASLLLFSKLRRLRRHVRLARRRYRADDVDVDVDDRRAVRRGTEFRDRTPDGHGRPE
jgi:hypothetical protein